MTPPTANLAAWSRKPAPVDHAVDVGVEQDEQILVEVVGGLALHLCGPPWFSEGESNERPLNVTKRRRGRQRFACVHGSVRCPP